MCICMCIYIYIYIYIYGDAHICLHPTMNTRQSSSGGPTNERPDMGDDDDDAGIRTASLLSMTRRTLRRAMREETTRRTIKTTLKSCIVSYACWDSAARSSLSALVHSATFARSSTIPRVALALALAFAFAVALSVGGDGRGAPTTMARGVVTGAIAPHMTGEEVHDDDKHDDGAGKGDAMAMLIELGRGTMREDEEEGECNGI